MSSFNALREVSELDSTIVMRKYSILAEITLPTGAEPVGDEAKMLVFLASVVESSFETSHSALNDSNNGRKMLYRSEIDNHGE